MDRFVRQFPLFAAIATTAGYAALGPAGAILVLGTMFWVRARLRRRGIGDPGRGSEDDRLAAFMAEATRAALANTTGPASPPQRTGAPSVPPERTAAPRPGFDELRVQSAGLGRREAFEALAEARLAAIEQPRDAHASAQAALLLNTLDATPPMRAQAAARAIERALASGQNTLAVQLFGEFAPVRSVLPLPPAQWERLGRALVGQGALLEGAWALHAGAARAGDTVVAQKRLVEIADLAARQGQPAIAVKLYDTLLAKYPDSGFAAFVRDNLKREQKRITRT